MFWLMAIGFLIFEFVFKDFCVFLIFGPPRALLCFQEDGHEGQGEGQERKVGTGISVMACQNNMEIIEQQTGVGRKKRREKEKRRRGQGIQNGALNGSVLEKSLAGT